MKGSITLAEVDRSNLWQGLDALEKISSGRYNWNSGEIIQYAKELKALIERDQPAQYCECADGPTCQHREPEVYPTNICARCGRPVREKEE